MDWTQVLTVFGVVATNLITVITLYIHMDNKTQATLNGFHETLKGITNEMKDFHGRLCAIEAERTKILLSK